MKCLTHRAIAVFAAMLIVSGCSQRVVDGGSGGQGVVAKPLVFATVPDQQSANLQQNFQPILEMLRKETRREVRFLVATNYAAVIEGTRTGEIDIANLGPFAYVIAKNQGAPITAVAARISKKGGTPGYRSYGITRSGSPIKTLADFRGKKVCFVDRNSTSGYLYPNAGLLAVGIKLEQDTKPIFVGGHDASVLAVASAQCDAGFAYDTMVDHQLIVRGQIELGQIITVWKSPVIPGAPMVVSNDLPPLLREQLTTALQQKANADYLRTNGFCQVKCAIAGGDGYGFAPVDDAFYDGVREVCRITQDKSCTNY